MTKLKQLLTELNTKSKLDQLDYTKLKKALIARRRNPEDVDTHDAVVIAMVELLKQAGAKDANESDIRVWMEDEVFAGEEGVSAAIKQFKDLALEYLEDANPSSTTTNIFKYNKEKTDSGIGKNVISHKNEPLLVVVSDNKGGSLLGMYRRRELSSWLGQYKSSPEQLLHTLLQLGYVKLGVGSKLNWVGPSNVAKGLKVGYDHPAVTGFIKSLKDSGIVSKP